MAVTEIGWRGALGLLLAAPTGWLAAGPAFAFGLGGLLGGGGIGSIVYDPTNHLETAVSAAQAVQQTALQVRAEVQRLQQLAVELQQLKALPQDSVRAVLADWSSQLGVLEQAGRQLATLDDLLGEAQRTSAGQLRQIAALGLSPQTWLDREVAAANRRQQSAEALFLAERQSLGAIGHTRQALGRLQAQIPASSGVQQSLQTANQYLDLLAGQSSQLLQLTAARSASAARQQSVAEADAALAGDREAQRTTRDLQDIARLRSDLRQQEARKGWGLLPPLRDSQP